MNRKEQEYEMYRYDIIEQWGCDAHWENDMIGGNIVINNSYTIEAKDLRVAVESKMPFEDFVKWQNFQQEQKTKISLRIWIKRMKH